MKNDMMKLSTTKGWVASKVIYHQMIYNETGTDLNRTEFDKKTIERKLVETNSG